jgi:hypothetical protein
MLYKRSMPERLKRISLKDLPDMVQDKVNNLSRILEISEGAVIHAMVTDWAAREAAEMSMFGKKKNPDVYPFQFDMQTNVILGNDLFRLLKTEHMKALAPDDASEKAFEKDLTKLRKEIEKSKEAIGEKIDLVLKWIYENTGLPRTKETDRTLSYMVLIYQRAGFSPDQVKELISEEAEYFKKKGDKNRDKKAEPDGSA